MNKTFDELLQRDENLRLDALQEVYNEIMSKVKYFGSNNCKCITEEELAFIFRNRGIYEVR